MEWSSFINVMMKMAWMWNLTLMVMRVNTYVPSVRERRGRAELNISRITQLAMTLVIGVS